MILQVKEVSKHFGGLKAVNNLSFTVADNSIWGVIGPNGAGKTTLFNCLTGTYQLTSGEILFNDESIAGLKPSKVAEKGLIRTFQGNKIFPGFTVYENVLMGADRRTPTKAWEEILGIKKAKRIEKEAHEKVMEILDFLELTAEKDFLGKNLSHGSQRRLAIATALASNPKLLLLDEPATGMNPEETADLMDHIRKINKMGITIVLIEHDMKLVMNICEKITVISFGEKIAEGSPKEIAQNKQVIEAYLGRGSQF